MYIDLHVQYRYSCQILMKLEFCRQCFEQLLKYHMSWKSVQWEPSCSMRTDGQTDMTKLIVAVRNFANAPNFSQFGNCA
jgi:hypothetical protein